jgi:hypothetical protein
VVGAVVALGGRPFGLPAEAERGGQRGSDFPVVLNIKLTIEKNPALVLPERNLDVLIPVQAIPNGYTWDEVGTELLIWLTANHTVAPMEGTSRHTVTVCRNSRKGPLDLDITLHTVHLPGLAGNCLICRN